MRRRNFANRIGGSREKRYKKIIRRKEEENELPFDRQVTYFAILLVRLQHIFNVVNTVSMPRVFFSPDNFSVTLFSRSTQAILKLSSAHETS
jgi:hypothetical protein